MGVLIHIYIYIYLSLMMVPHSREVVTHHPPAILTGPGGAVASTHTEWLWRFDHRTVQRTGDTPGKINMEAENDSLVQMIFRILIGWFLGSMSIFRGVKHSAAFFSGEELEMHLEISSNYWWIDWVAYIYRPVLFLFMFYPCFYCLFDIFGIVSPRKLGKIQS